MSTHKLFRTFPILFCLLATACTTGTSPAPSPEVTRVPYRILLHYSSALPDPYYVLSGPFRSYRRFAVNESLQHRLETYLIAKSDPHAGQTLEVTVHVISLQTTYDQIGNNPHQMRPARLVAAWHGSSGQAPLTAFDSDFDGWDDDRPEQIIKTASMQAQVTVTTPDLPTSLQELVTGKVVDILERQDMGLWTYDYDNLIAQVQLATIHEIDQVINRALQQRGVTPR